MRELWEEAGFLELFKSLQQEARELVNCSGMLVLKGNVKFKLRYVLC